MTEQTSLFFAGKIAEKEAELSRAVADRDYWQGQINKMISDGYPDDANNYSASHLHPANLKCDTLSAELSLLKAEYAKAIKREKELKERVEDSHEQSLPPLHEGNLNDSLQNYNVGETTFEDELLNAANNLGSNPSRPKGSKGRLGDTVDTTNAPKTGLAAFFYMYQMSPEGYPLLDPSSGKRRLNYVKVVGFGLVGGGLIYFFFFRKKGKRMRRF